MIQWKTTGSTSKQTSRTSIRNDQESSGIRRLFDFFLAEHWPCNLFLLAGLLNNKKDKSDTIRKHSSDPVERLLSPTYD